MCLFLGLDLIDFPIEVRLGFAFSLFILHLTVTGILLTYPKTFNVEETYVSNFFILKKYNMNTHREVYGLNNIKDEVVIIELLCVAPKVGPIRESNRNGQTAPG